MNYEKDNLWKSAVYPFLIDSFPAFYCIFFKMAYTVRKWKVYKVKNNGDDDEG